MKDILYKRIMQAAFLILICCISYLQAGGVKSTTGQINFDIDGDGNPEMRLNSTGLGVGQVNGRSSLELQGSLGMNIENVSEDTTLSENSLVFANSELHDLHLTLPYASNVTGRMYTIKKSSANNTVYISGGGNLIDDLERITMGSDLGPFPSIDLVSNGQQWFVLRPSGYSSPVAADNLIGYWSMDDTSGNIILDESGEGQNGDAINMSDSELKVLGQIGKAISFSGGPGYVLPDSPDPGYFHDEFTERSLSFWCTVGVGGGGPRMLWDEGGTTNGLGIAYRTTPDTICYATKVGGTTVEIASTSTFPEDDSVWVHVVVVYDNGAMRLYINGEEEASDTNGTSVPAHTNPPSMGNASTPDGGQFTNPTPWVGRFDEVRWYNIALNQTEIMALYNRVE